MVHPNPRASSRTMGSVAAGKWARFAQGPPRMVKSGVVQGQRLASPWASGSEEGAVPRRCGRPRVRRRATTFLGDRNTSGHQASSMGASHPGCGRPRRPRQGPRSSIKPRTATCMTPQSAFAPGPANRPSLGASPTIAKWPLTPRPNFSSHQCCCTHRHRGRMFAGGVHHCETRTRSEAHTLSLRARWSNLPCGAHPGTRRTSDEDRTRQNAPRAWR